MSLPLSRVFFTGIFFCTDLPQSSARNLCYIPDSMCACGGIFFPAKSPHNDDPPTSFFNFSSFLVSSLLQIPLSFFGKKSRDEGKYGGLKKRRQSQTLSTHKNPSFKGFPQFNVFPGGFSDSTLPKKRSPFPLLITNLRRTMAS